MTAVEIDAVTCIEYENLGIDRELQRSVDDEVKLLSVMCVLVVIASIGQWIDSDKERINLSGRAGAWSADRKPDPEAADRKAAPVLGG